MDYIELIRDYLTSIKVDHSKYDDDRTYYDGYDDVWVVALNNETYKFVQNLKNGKATNIMMISGSISLYKYNEIIDYLKNTLCTK
jgi:hypothetical protein